MDAHVGLEAEAVDDGHEAAHAVERGAGQRAVREDVAPAPGEDGVQGRDRVGGAGHRDEVQRFEQAGGGGEEGGVERAPGGGDDLAGPARNAVGGEGEVGDFEAGITDGYFF